MSKETMKLALEALNAATRYGAGGFEDAKDALRAALAKPDFWEGYVLEPVKPAQQCKWPTCQSEEYQQALAEQIKRELVGEQPAQRTWVGLSKEDKWEIVQATERDDRGYVMALVEARLKELNT